jgi:hypothetical protein
MSLPDKDIRLAHTIRNLRFYLVAFIFFDGFCMGVMITIRKRANEDFH